jgi:HAD superfamily hydrolase (TIGR01493 family)
MSATTTPFPKAVIFDAYGTLFDVHSVIAAAEQMFPGHGDALSQLWRQKQIEYTQLRTLADPAGAPGAHYRPFWDITLDALRFAAKKLHLTLGRAAEKRLMDEYACLSAFPDAVPTLRQLRDRGRGRGNVKARSRDPLERQSANARRRREERRHDGPVRPCSIRRRCTRLQTLARGLRARHTSLRRATARDRLRIVERLGRGRRELVRLHDFLA